MASVVRAWVWSVNSEAATAVIVVAIDASVLANNVMFLFMSQSHHAKAIT